MRIVTWNVNSLRARLARVEEWIAAHEPDVVCLQETKCADGVFPAAAFSALGYESVHHGDSQWNGVAILSRVGLEDARGGFVDESPAPQGECRLVSASCDGVRVLCVYVPNGRVVGSEHFVTKLAWLAHLRAELDATCTAEEQFGIFGDFNVAPTDRDVWDIEKFVGMTHVTPDERAALAGVVEFGLVDAVRSVRPDADEFSWWDYRGGAFHRGWGMRIDLALLSSPLAARLVDAYVDRDARKGQGTERQPSDHAPVVVDLA